MNDEEPINVDPPTVAEMVNASNKLGCAKSQDAETPRAERLAQRKAKLEALWAEATQLVQNRASVKAYRLLNEISSLEEVIWELETFKDDEEFRQWLLTQEKQGHH